MTRSLLIACYEVPGWGGASTRAYLLFERLQRDGWDVAFLNLVRGREEAPLRRLFGERFGNPRSLPNVHTLILNEPTGQTQTALVELVCAVAPELTLAFGFIAANILKTAVPSAPLVFMTVGTHDVSYLVETGAATDFMAFRDCVATVDFPPDPADRERHAAEVSDRIIFNSPIVRFAFDRRFPALRDKAHPRTISLADLVYAAAEEFAALQRPFAQRDIDVLFVASNWARPVKNYALVREIAARSAGRKVRIVGAFDDPCPNAAHEGIVPSRSDLFALLGRSKTLVCPSLVDAAPGVLFEASAMGCNVVASRNCGNWELCNEELVAERCEVADFIDRIGRSLAGPYPDNRQRFRGGYGELVDALEQFQPSSERLG